MMTSQTVQKLSYWQINKQAHPRVHKNPGFFKNPTQWVFWSFGFYWVSRGRFYFNLQC